MASLQFGLTLALIVWFALFPLRGRARIAHMLMTGAMLVLIILYCQWLFPSAFTPLGLLLLFVLAVFLGRRRPSDHRHTVIWPGFLASLAALCAAAGVGNLVIARLPPATSFDVTMPLSSRAAVTEGGTNRLINRHLAVLDADTPSLSGWRGGAYAISLQPVDNLGRPLTAAQSILAPCDRVVLGQGHDPRLGRYLTLDCSGKWVVLSSVETVVATGAVKIGAPIGTAATLTLHAQKPGNAAHPFSGDPVWITLNGVFATRGRVLWP